MSDKKHHSIEVENRNVTFCNRIVWFTVVLTYDFSVHRQNISLLTFLTGLSRHVLFLIKPAFSSNNIS